MGLLRRKKQQLKQKVEMEESLEDRRNPEVPVATAELEIGGRKLQVEVGRMARSADGSAVLRYGDTIVLATAVMSKQAREDVDYFPLLVDFEEKMYAVGKIPGSRWIRREGRPSEKATVTARMIDRPLRPLFREGMRNEVQIVITVLSADDENSPDIIGLNAASFVLRLAGIPVIDTVAAVRLGKSDGQFIPNPTYAQIDEGGVDIVVVGTRSAINMLEVSATEISEEDLSEACAVAHEYIKQLVDFIDDFAASNGKPTRECVCILPNEELKSLAQEKGCSPIDEALHIVEREEREAALEAISNELRESLLAEFPDNKQEINLAIDSVIKQRLRRMLVEEGRRSDGRSLTQIRPLHCEVGLLPRAHGSGLFARGGTQILSVATLGTVSEEKLLEGIGEEDSKRFMHQYNFPPFSTGEIAPLRGPKRREIGHGALAERALGPIMPQEETFPYTIRIVSEALESNGSTSMASVCGSTLALMDAGVPISAPAAGIAIGLVRENNKHLLLTDIAGIEDAYGDMDFKVAGTESGITAVQFDLKIEGIPVEIIAEILQRAREARLQILAAIRQTIEKPRENLSPYAPRILFFQLDPSKIGAVIGPGGKIIKSIIEQTGASIDVEDDGKVFIASVDEEMARLALKRIQDIVAEVEVGAVYTGKVTRTIEIGAFVEILPGKEGMIHIRDISWEHINKVEDVLNVGDEVMVKVTGVDDRGRINLSRKVLLAHSAGQEADGSDRESQRKPHHEAYYLRDKRRPRS
jgi:polyribonucleotide nucleotidyltransferase